MFTQKPKSGRFLKFEKVFEVTTMSKYNILETIVEKIIGTR